ncbi:MAG: IS110 family transposase [Gammaproteobacteria bacterium]
MAKQVEPVLIGADVSKAEIVLCVQARSGVQTVANERALIRRYLRSFAGPLQIAVEATNTFHLSLVEEAHALGHRVYVIDGYRLNRYRESVGGRAKTDRCDAELLLRYLEREGQDLRPWMPPPAGYVSLQRLLHRRAVVVQARMSLTQSFADLPELKSAVRGLLQRFQQLDRMLQRRIAQVAVDTGIGADLRRCQAIEGIGPLTAAALANTFRRGAFSSSDAFIAFLGLDVRVRESGTYRGRRRLTKQGDSETRRLLFNAAMAAIRAPHWRSIYKRYLQRGLKKTQALVILCRKLARIAFALMKNQSDYQPALACSAT